MSEEQQASEKPPVWQTPSFLASAVVVGLVIMFGVVLAVRPLLPEPTPPATHPPLGDEGLPVDPSPDIPRLDGSDSACGLDGSQASTFDGFPNDTHWNGFVGAVQVPTSPTHGPGHVEEDGFRSCWAKTPEGAVFAALTYLALANDAELALRTAEEMLAEGEGKEHTQELVSEHGIETVRAEHRGVRLISYGTDRARVDAAATVGDLSSDDLLSMPVDLRWEDGDWKVVTREDGSMMIPPSSMRSLDHYVPITVES